MAIIINIAEAEWDKACLCSSERKEKGCGKAEAYLESSRRITSYLLEYSEEFSQHMAWRPLSSYQDLFYS